MSPRTPLREPMVWLVVGLPVVAVVAGIGLLVVATRSGSSDAVIDTVARTAQIQTTELGPDARAQALKLSAVLQVDGNRLRLLPASGGWVRDTTGSSPGEQATDDAGGDAARRRQDATAHEQSLLLVLSHPTDADRDLRLRMQPESLGWRVELPTPLDGDHDWLVQLTPPDTQWRLHGRLVAGQQATRLGPSLVTE
ncbi:FixH family protein [Marilutibacter aestuarii]|uniref:Nitrogen fixation protein FixH n=1 Tax=Marilutibacter aestuarii TaxID=1706195 RepID=A0A508AM04_9GAMM|nr:FixH family protein [Lysobacter aestuarii]TQD50966.1 nitrogen fixation protein FixH [Lysobacter aestuarii]